MKLKVKQIKNILKSRFPRKLKKAVARVLVIKDNGDGTSDISININLKCNTKWNRKVNRMILFDGVTLILPFKNGTFRRIDILY